MPRLRKSALSFGIAALFNAIPYGERLKCFDGTSAVFRGCAGEEEFGRSESRRHVATIGAHHTSCNVAPATGVLADIGGRHLENEAGTRRFPRSSKGAEQIALRERCRAARSIMGQFRSSRVHYELATKKVGISLVDVANASVGPQET
jgi:hypothetical protein